MVDYDYTAATTVQFRVLQPTGDAEQLRMMMGAIAPTCVIPTSMSWPKL